MRMKYLIYTISEQTCNLHGYELVLMRKHINLTCQLIASREHVYVKTTDILNFNRQIADKTLPRISKYCLHFSQQVDLVRFVLTMNSKKQNCLLLDFLLSHIKITLKGQGQSLIWSLNYFNTFSKS